MDTSLEEVASGRELVAAIQDAASPVSTGSQSSASKIVVGDASSGDVLGTQIDTLRYARAALVADRSRLMNELKNAEKRRRRLKQRAQSLSTDDLVAAMQMGASQASEPNRKMAFAADNITSTSTRLSRATHETIHTTVHHK